MANGDAACAPEAAGRASSVSCSLQVMIPSQDPTASRAAATTRAFDPPILHGMRAAPDAAVPGAVGGLTRIGANAAIPRLAIAAAGGVESATHQLQTTLEPGLDARDRLAACFGDLGGCVAFEVAAQQGRRGTSSAAPSPSRRPHGVSTHVRPPRRSGAARAPELRPARGPVGACPGGSARARGCAGVSRARRAGIGLGPAEVQTAGRGGKSS